ncbi:DNA methylase [Sulfolobales archaeon HS-7]|nr:DNA methylase [Sulfolobales archaeon HS-7]
MKFSRYLGRELRKKIFVIDTAKAKQNQVSAEHIKGILARVGITIPEKVFNEMKDEIEGNFNALVWSKGNHIIIKPYADLSAVIYTLNELCKHNMLLDIYICDNFRYSDLIELFKQKNIHISNKIRLRLHTLDAHFLGNLREYQIQALERWKANGSRGVISLPTGTGKTIIGAAAISELNIPTVIIGYTLEQLRQWENLLRQHLGGQYVFGYLYGRSKTLGDIVLATYQSAFRNFMLLKDYPFLIVDEVHHLPAEKFRFIATNALAPFRLGLSATPFRDDGMHTFLFEIMGGLVYYKDPEELKDYLAHYESKTIKISLTEEERIRYLALLKEIREASKGRTLGKLLQDARKKDPSAIYALKISTEIREFVGLVRKKQDLCKLILQEELERGSKVIIFTQYVDHARRLSELLNVDYITGKTSRKEREKRLEKFRQAKSAGIILTTIGDEGLDIPDVNVGIIVSGTSSKRQYVQRLGRVIRKNGDKRAILYELIAKGTFEEYQAKKRKRVSLDEMFYFGD